MATYPTGEPEDSHEKPSPSVEAVEVDGFSVRNRLSGDDTQTALFLDNEFIIPDSLRTFQKSASLIQSIALNKSHTLNTRKLMDAAAVVVQLECRERGPDFIAKIIKERISPQFEVRGSELAKLAGIAGNSNKRLIEDVESLYRMDFQWNILNEDGQIAWNAKSHFFSYIATGLEKNRGLLRFSMDPEILKLILEPKMWVRLSLSVKNGLGTSAAYELWQFGYRYLGTQNSVTAQIPVDTLIRMLVGPSKYVSTDEKGKVTIQYADFKRRVLLDAIMRVNAIPSLTHTLELKEIKYGNRVAKIQFKLVAKRQVPLDLAPLAWPEAATRLLAIIGYTPTEISELGQKHSFEVINESLMRLEKTETRKRALGEKVWNRKAFFNGILNKVADGAVLAELTDEKIEEEARSAEIARRTDERKERQQQDFVNHKRQIFRGNFFEALNEADRTAMFEKFAASEYGRSQQLLLSKGIDSTNTAAFASIYLGWLEEHDQDTLQKLLPAPEDRSFEAWLSWRLDASTE